MIKLEKKSLSQLDKELFLGNLVTWGSIISALVVVIAVATVNAAEKDQAASTSRVEAAPHVKMSDKS